MLSVDPEHYIRPPSTSGSMTLRYSLLSVCSVLFILFSSESYAQEQLRCGTDDVHRQMLANDPHLAQAEAQAELGLQEYLQMRAGLRDEDTAVYVIPIVFHILFDPTAASDDHNIPDSRIYEEMNTLNRDFRKLNPDTIQVVNAFAGLVGNSRVEFRLASKDPLGNCTNGIDRITTQRSSSAQDFSKLDPWFRDRYLNVWLVRSFTDPGLGGYSNYPSSVQDAFGALKDGVILLNGTVGGSSDPSTLTHEIGHYLNLAHVWGDTNDPTVACGDDGVPDTPITKGHVSCMLTDFTCSDQAADTVYNFNAVTTTSGSTDPSPVPTVFLAGSIGQGPNLDEGLTLSPFTAAGVSANSASNDAFAFSQWGIGASDGDPLFTDLTGTLSTSAYYQFTVTPLLGKAMNVTGLTFDVDRSGTGPRTFAVRSSATNYASNLSASIPADNEAIAVETPQTFFFIKDTTGQISQVHVNLSMATLTSPITFRIYAWNAEDASGSFDVDNVTFEADFGVIENVQNFMEYSGCNYMFTVGQGERMRAALNSSVSSRNNLWTESNHSYTGIEGYEQTCGPQAGFYTMTPFVCANTPVQFKDNSTKATPTSWAWSFEGGNPATSTEQDPTVSFTSAGPHAITLTVGNDVGSSTLTLNAVTIGADYSEASGLLNEPFNTIEDFWKWPTVNYENNLTAWGWNSALGHNAPGSVKLNASQTYVLAQDIFVPNNFSDKDLLITPTLDLTYGHNLELSFWLAYATQTSDADLITEKLKVWSSTDCGKTWLMRKEISGGDLITAGVASAGYTPASGDWRQVTLPIATSLQTDHVRFKFEYSSGMYSNDMFIDDINISGNVGIDELAQSGSLSLMPNPAADHLTVEVDLASSKEGTINFIDMTGRILFTQQVQSGKERMEFDLDRMGLSSGVYLVQLKHANGERVERLVVR